MGRYLIALVLVVAFCLGAGIGYYNWTHVRFHYLAGEAELPLIALLLMAFVLGIAVMWLLGLARRFALTNEARRHQRQIRDLQAELNTLRNLPLERAPTAPANPPVKDA